MSLETFNPILRIWINVKKNKKLICDTVQLIKVRFCSNFTKFYASIHYLFLYLIQDSTSYLVALSSFSYMQQILVNSLFIFFLLQIFSNFPCYSFLVFYVLSCVWLFVAPWTVAHQAPLSIGFPRPEYWSGCHFLLRGIFLTHVLNLCLLDLH